jgi:hypothetical protein
VSLDARALYGLLPAVYRTRDAASGGPLQALFAVMAAQAAVVEDNINQLYDDQFIETCAPWVIPYLGDLIGYNSVYEIASASTDSRAEVADTVGYRRRKGTLLALEQLAQDVSGRPALAVEGFRHLITTESMRHPRPGHDATVNLRDGRALRRLGTAFDAESRTADVRRIAPRPRAAARPDPTPLDMALHGGGRAGLPDVAIHLWRVQSWPVTGAPATPAGARQYRFSPLGHDLPLLPSPPARLPFSRLTARPDVPLPITGPELASYYGPGQSILLTADGSPVPAGQVYGANLADRPGGAWCTVTAGKIAIDPGLGRIQFAADLPVPQSLEVSYWYGFPAALGGGPYDRSAALAGLDPAGADYFAIAGAPGGPGLPSAVAGWNQAPAGSAGLIVLSGFASLAADLTGLAAVRLPAGSRLVLAAGQPVPDGGPRDVTWAGAQVTLTGDLEVAGSADPAGTAAPGQLLISGVCLAGQLRVTGAATAVQLADATLVPGLSLLPDGGPVYPGDPSIVVTATGTALALDRVISGPVAADPSGTTQVSASIIDATSPFYAAYAGPDLAGPGADLSVADSTVIGKVRPRTMTLASNTIFHARLGRSDPWPAAVWASRQQAGCVRFCVLPFGSVTPRRYQCLPPDAAAEPALEPVFVTLRYGQPGYALLSGDVPVAVWTGADNGSQLGAYLQIQETEAVSNVQLRAPEYLPALLESGIYLHPAHEQPEVPLVSAAYGYYPRRYGGPPGIPGIGTGLL